MIEEILLIIAAYILGSIPFGHIITKLSTGKNIMQVGWEKTSSSNVLKHIGVWQGLLTFILDIAKGFFAVWLARYFGTAIAVQVICGIMAVIGHNWSVFMGFRGGRGLAALIGALLIISPKVLIISLIPCILFTVIWTASVGTLLSFLAGIIFSFSFREYFPAGFLMLFSLIPVLIKRLSPLQDILRDTSNKDLLENRLIFDQDSVPPIRLKMKKKGGK
jgi:acyl phosphate:glycerol-3-phosphate acyltransferase